MPEETDLHPKSFRKIEKIEDLANSLESPEGQTIQTLAVLAQTLDIDDMRQLAAHYIELINQAQPGATEVKTEITLENVDDMSRKLVSGIIISTGFLANKGFEVPWQSRYEPKGLFGPIWENGYLIFQRNQPPQVYENLIKVYTTQLTRAQEWKRQQIRTSMSKLRELLEEVKNK